MTLPNPSSHPSFLVRVRPQAQKDEILVWDGDCLEVAIAAPASDNKANVRLIKFLSKQLANPVRIKSGATHKTKRLVFV